MAIKAEHSDGPHQGQLWAVALLSWLQVVQ